MERLGFIGMGNMAQALCAGFVNSGKIAAESVYAYAPHYDKLVKNSEKYGFTPCKTLAELVDAVDTVIMACKPYQINDVLVEIGERLHGKALVSVAAGWDFKKYSEYFDSSVRVQFVMPNTPAMVYEGVMLFEAQNSLEEEERAQIKELFAAVGIVEELPSNLMGIGGAVTGCKPQRASIRWMMRMRCRGKKIPAKKKYCPIKPRTRTHLLPRRKHSLQ